MKAFLAIAASLLVQVVHSQKGFEAYSTGIEDPELILKAVDVYELALFTCTGYGGAASSQVEWLKNGSPLSEDPRYKFSEIDLRSSKERLFIFMIINAQYEDSAIYSCRIQSSESNKNYRIFYQLIVKDPEPISLTIRTREGSIFICDFIAETHSLITWKKDGRPLPGNPRFKITGIKDSTTPESVDVLKELGLVRSASILQIDFANLKDSGTYTCIDEHPRNYYSKKQYSLHVVERELAKLEVHVGTPVYLLCHRLLRVAPQFIWLKDGAPLPEDSRLFVIEEKEDIQDLDLPANNPLSRFLPDAKYTSKLHIDNSRVGDSAKYTCYDAVSDPEGKGRLEMFLTVRDR